MLARVLGFGRRPFDSLSEQEILALAVSSDAGAAFRERTRLELQDTIWQTADLMYANVGKALQVLREAIPAGQGRLTHINVAQIVDPGSPFSAPQPQDNLLGKKKSLQMI